MAGFAWGRSSIGKKALMALSGLILFGFIVGHLLGNLLIFRGPEALNAYALKLRKLGPGLWMVRIALFLALLVHVWTSERVTRENLRARPQPYRAYRPEATTLAARTMMLSGIALMVFLIYHLLHFTVRVTNPEVAHLTDAAGHHDVYRMVVLSFQRWPIVVAYLIGVGAVCLHLSHGIGSSVQTLGLNTPQTIGWTAWAGRLAAWAIFLGYASIPVAVLCGVVR